MGIPHEPLAAPLLRQNDQADYLQVRCLISDHELSQSFALRYQVYCKERQFLQACAYPSGLEIDEHDVRSQHFGVYHHEAGMAGAVRLVRPDDAGRFPFHHHRPQLYTGLALPAPEQAAEVSRLVVRPSIRRRPQANPDLATPIDAKNRDYRSSNIVLNLYKAIYQHSKRGGITHLYAAMEQSLARLLSRLHFPFVAVGPEFDYFGPVAVYVTRFDEMDERLARCNPMLLEWFQDDLTLPAAATGK